MSIPYTYKMVDFSGLDLATVNFSVVDGIYNKIVEAIGDWGVAVFYNWFFGEIPITPQHCQVTLEDGYLMINGIIKVTEYDEVGIPALVPQPVVPTLVDLSVTENGIYLPSDYDADGFSSADVDVPAGALIGEDVPTSDIGDVGDYYIRVYDYQPETYMLGIEITVAARGSQYNFTYWGARSIDAVFEDDNGNTFNLQSASDKKAYWASGNGSFSSQDALVSGSITTYYEHSGIPGYFCITGTVPTGYKFKSLKVYGRSDSSWQDYWRTFEVQFWTGYRTSLKTLLARSNLVYSDWEFGEYTVFQNETPVDLTVYELYVKTASGWEQVL